jgi:hypothetical protein
MVVFVEKQGNKKPPFARSDSDLAIFDVLVAYLSIEDCHATLIMTRGEVLGIKQK